jgi:hypothetical protein
MFTAAVRAADPGEAGARIAAIEVPLGDFPDDRPEMTGLLLETALVDCQESIEVLTIWERQAGQPSLELTVVVFF